jgi:hypothetical protein
MIARCSALLLCLLIAGCGTAQPPDGRTRPGLISGFELVLKGNDQNGDGKLSRAEVEGMVDSGLVPYQKPPRNYAEIRDQLLRAYAAQDLDHDGYLTLAELLKQPLATFSCMDTNGNGSLSQQEIEGGMENCDSERVHVASLGANARNGS